MINKPRVGQTTRIGDRTIMCQFLSAIVTQTGNVLQDEYTDNHEDLILQFHLDDSCREPVRWVRVEFKPGEDFLDADSYVLDLDESTAPDWWDGRMEAARRALRCIVKKMIVNGKKDILLGGAWMLGSDANLWTAKCARIIYMSGGTLNHMHGGILRDMSGGTLNHMHSGGLNHMHGGTLNHMYGGTLDHMHSGTLNYVYDGTLINMHGGTLDHMYGGTLINMHGGTLINWHGGNIIENTGGKVMNDLRKK